MAIYSLNLASIGRYNGRPDAQPALVAEHMPPDPTQAGTWMDQAERVDHKNARVKVRIALPRDLTPEEGMQLVQDFATDLTKGRVPWYATIHASGKDAHNPHFHLVIRDLDIETGKPVVHLSDSARDRTKAGLEPKAVEWVRSKWEDHANRALERAGHDARIDRRSLEAQGIDREPTVHIGPQAQHIDKRVSRPESKFITTGNGRVIDYRMIDAGRTRQERHAEIVDFNLEKGAKSPDFRTREKSRYADMKREVVARYRPGLSTMLDRHRAADDDADQQRQERTAERDLAQQRFAEKLHQVEWMQEQKRNRDVGRRDGWARSPGIFDAKILNSYALWKYYTAVIGGPWEAISMRSRLRTGLLSAPIY